MYKPSQSFSKKYFFILKPKAKDALFYLLNILAIFSTRKFQGWGRKRTGEFAYKCYNHFGGKIIRYEDGFIRSIGLGVDGHPSFSLVEDDIGLFLDSSKPSRLESILNTYDFQADEKLLLSATKAIALIKNHRISKYNHSKDIDDNYFGNDTKRKVLIIAQTAGDASLKYGLSDPESSKLMITDAIRDNPSTSIYLKIHPDVLAGKKESNIPISAIPKNCHIIDQDVNPISLLSHFDKIYTCTSGMGMEALILHKEVICYGIPFYAGWGLTTDIQNCDRRNRNLSITELFAGSYILYTQYYDPYKKTPLDIFGALEAIIKSKY